MAVGIRAIFSLCFICFPKGLISLNLLLFPSLLFLHLHLFKPIYLKNKTKKQTCLSSLHCYSYSWPNPTYWPVSASILHHLPSVPLLPSSGPGKRQRELCSELWSTLSSSVSHLSSPHYEMAENTAVLETSSAADGFSLMSLSALADFLWRLLFYRLLLPCWCSPIFTVVIYFPVLTTLSNFPSYRVHVSSTHRQMIPKSMLPPRPGL